MDILMWILVGLVAGVGASLLFGAVGSIFFDIVIGMAGAFVGGFIFHVTGWHTPCGGLTGTIVVAFVGSVVELGGLRLVRRVRPKA
jgi:uncharacterized membrane protein YeaQ/YmgE (transglycosylase-associated protein family)